MPVGTERLEKPFADVRLPDGRTCADQDDGAGHGRVRSMDRRA